MLIIIIYLCILVSKFLRNIVYQIVPEVFWSEWSSWLACSQSCGSGGFQSKERTCMFAAAEYKNYSCEGNPKVHRKCKQVSCSGCLSYSFAFLSNLLVF